MELSKNRSGPKGIPEDPPPYHGYQYGPPLPGASVTTVIPGAVIIQQSLGPKPVTAICQSCNSTTLTKVKWKATTRTHMVAGGLALLGLWPAVWVPYCMESTRNAEHYCTKCEAFIGSYVR